MTTRTDHENDPRPDENVDSFQKHFFLPRVEGFFGHLCLFVGLFIYTCVGAWVRNYAYFVAIHTYVHFLTFTKKTNTKLPVINMQICKYYQISRKRYALN